MERISRWPSALFIFLLAYMPFHVFLSQWLSTYTGELDFWKIAKDLLLLLGILLTAGLVYIKNGFRNRRFWLFFGFSALYLILHVLVWRFTHVTDKTALLATAYNCRLPGFAVLGWAAAILAPKDMDARKIFRIAVIISSIVCLLGIIQYLLPKDFLTHFGYSLERGVKPAFFIDDKLDLPRIMSTLRDPNSLGAYLILPITLLVGVWLKKPRLRMLLSGLILLHGLALFLTFSRSAWAGALLSSGIIFIWHFKEKTRLILKRHWPVIAVVLVIFFAGIFALRNQYTVQNVIFHADKSTKLADSNDLHLKFAENGIKGIADKPLGHGPGTAGLVSIHSNNVVLTENYFIQIGYETGVIGLLILIGLMAFVCRELYIRNDFYAHVLLASFVGITLCSLLLLTWSNEAVAAEWWLLAGLAVGTAGRKLKLKS